MLFGVLEFFSPFHVLYSFILFPSFISLRLSLLRYFNSYFILFLVPNSILRVPSHPLPSQTPFLPSFISPSSTLLISLYLLFTVFPSPVYSLSQYLSSLSVNTLPYPPLIPDSGTVHPVIRIQYSSVHFLDPKKPIFSIPGVSSCELTMRGNISPPVESSIFEFDAGYFRE